MHHNEETKERHKAEIRCCYDGTPESCQRCPFDDCVRDDIDDDPCIKKMYGKRDYIKTGIQIRKRNDRTEYKRAYQRAYREQMPEEQKERYREWQRLYARRKRLEGI